MNKQFKISHIIPTIGILLFWGLYGYASTLYPGGSQINVDTVGFDWVHNYWCDLLGKEAANELPNPARPAGIVATLVLCLSLTIFFLQFAKNIAVQIHWKKAIAIGGTISMLLAAFVFTDQHDWIIIVSSLFALFAGVGMVIELYRSDLQTYKISGAACIALIIINNFLYYTEIGLEYLPLIQKVSFFIILFWVAALNIAMAKKQF